MADSVSLSPNYAQLNSNDSVWVQGLKGMVQKAAKDIVYVKDLLSKPNDQYGFLGGEKDSSMHIAESKPEDLKDVYPDMNVGIDRYYRPPSKPSKPREEPGLMDHLAALYYHGDPNVGSYGSIPDMTEQERMNLYANRLRVLREERERVKQEKKPLKVRPLNRPIEKPSVKQPQSLPRDVVQQPMSYPEDKSKQSKVYPVNKSGQIKIVDQQPYWYGGGRSSLGKVVPTGYVYRNKFVPMKPSRMMPYMQRKNCIKSGKCSPRSKSYLYTKQFLPKNKILRRNFFKPKKVYKAKYPYMGGGAKYASGRSTSYKKY